MPDYIPRQDAGFGCWQRNFHDYVAGHAAELEVSPEQVDALGERAVAFDEAMERIEAARIAYRSACAAKDDAREQLTKMIRAIAIRIQIRPQTTDSERAALGLTIPDPVRTPIPAPASVPWVMVRVERLRHLLRIRDSAHPSRKARPQGVIGCEVWRSFGEEEEDWSCIGLHSGNEVILTYNGHDAGRTARYRLRYFNGKAQTGPWSATMQAMVAA